MKKIAKILVSILTVSLFFTLTASKALAATNTVAGEEHTTIYQATTTNGVNRNIAVKVVNSSSVHKNDIAMYDKNSNLVWEESDAIPYSGQRTFWAGKNVYKIKMKIRGMTFYDKIMRHYASVNAW